MTAVALGLPPVRVRSATVEDVPAAVERPDSPQLIDSFGRRATDLRVSLTDRCNLRCTYCMPAEGLDWLPSPELLSDDELLRLIRIAVDRLGITEVRFTGGEPLLRKGIVDLVRAVGSLRNRPEMSLTTNGIGLARRAADFAAAGLDRVNVSLDTLDPETFLALTRRPRHGDVVAALEACATAGLAPVKVNAVLMRGVNDHEAPDLLQFCLDRGYQLRFIEQMPLDAGHSWKRSSMVTAAEILAALSARFELRPHRAPRNGAPAELFDVVGHAPGDHSASGDGSAAGEHGAAGDRTATVGVIASVTRPFCGDCDRTRLTADGQIRTCLFARTETDLRGLVRNGADDETIADAWRGAMWAKLPGHGINDESFLQPDRPMSAIGG